MARTRLFSSFVLITAAVLPQATAHAALHPMPTLHAQLVEPGQGSIATSPAISGSVSNTLEDTTTNSSAAPRPAPPLGASSRNSSDGGPSRTTANTSEMSAPKSGVLRISGLGGSSAPWTIVVLMTFLTLIPSLMICVTPFARLLVVFHFLRQALGLQTTPSNQTLIGLSLVLTFFIMEPVGKQIYQDSFIPLQNGQITAFEAISRGSDPMRHFMCHYVREKDTALFLDIAHAPRPRDINDVPMRVLMPAYIVSELKAGFQIGAVLFLPFLVVDLVVASITNSVGMMQLPPVVISTPLKLMLFLMVDGWHLLIGALVRSFN
jgi:flagellar biosynthesis protein FliP